MSKGQCPTHADSDVLLFRGSGLCHVAFKCLRRGKEGIKMTGSFIFLSIFDDAWWSLSTTLVLKIYSSLHCYGFHSRL